MNMIGNMIKMAVVLLLLLQLTMDAEGRRRKGSALRVYQGKDVTKEEYPYVMALILRRPEGQTVTAVRSCTCSLIKPNWVLIAAHCVDSIKQNEVRFYKVIYGDLTIPPNKTTFRRDIRKVYLHPGFFRNDVTKSSARNDIALLLIETLDLKPLAKISAVDYRSLIGYPVKYIGSGRTDSWQSMAQRGFKNSISANEDAIRPLQMGEAVIVKCDPKIFVFRFSSPCICMYGKCSDSSRGNPMTGDSGGPLLFREKIIGVCSALAPGSMDDIKTFKHFHRPNNRNNFGPTAFVYAPVSPYLDWIHQVTSCNST